jgi:lipoprotein NlpI
MHSSKKLIAATLLIATASTVLAASQHDRNDCGTSNPDGNIVSCPRVIDGGSGTIVNPAFADTRGIAYYSEGNRAVADLIELIGLDPNGPPVHRNRGTKLPVKSNVDRAIARYTKTIMLDPRNDDAYLRRGIANLYAGSLPKALADIRQASELDPKYAYYALWLDIVDKRENLASGLAQAATQIDMTKWPAPIIGLFLGHTTPGAVLAAAADPDAKTKAGQVCEANFYTGELALRQGAKEEAANLFRRAAAECPSHFVEGPAAYAELKVLGVNPLVSDTTQPLKSI